MYYSIDFGWIYSHPCNLYNRFYLIRGDTRKDKRPSRVYNPTNPMKQFTTDTETQLQRKVQHHDISPNLLKHNPHQTKTIT